MCPSVTHNALYPALPHNQISGFAAKYINSPSIKYLYFSHEIEEWKKHENSMQGLQNTNITSLKGFLNVKTTSITSLTKH